MELADVTDSKSVGLTPVWVRIPPLASQPLAENLRAVFLFFGRRFSHQFAALRHTFPNKNASVRGKILRLTHIFSTEEW